MPGMNSGAGAHVAAVVAAFRAALIHEGLLVLGDVTPVYPYGKGSWGPEEADRLLPDRDVWHDPAG